MVVVNYIIIFLLLGLSAIFSGLTLGLMSLDKFSLARKAKIGDKNAKMIYPLRKQGNLLLVTLLFGNVAVNATLAVFLGSITQGVLAGVLSTGLIVVFGEVIPQSVFSRHALKLGARMSWLVYIFLYLFYPISKPMAMILDNFLGGELPSIFSKKEFHVFLQEQREHKKSDIKEHEFKILEAGLVYSDLTVKEVMTPLKKTFFLSEKDFLTRSILSGIQIKGHSRIPVVSKVNGKFKIKGLLYMKDLVAISPTENIPIKKIMRKVIHRIRETDTLDKVMKLFKKKRIHLFIVNNNNNKFTGIITLEDVLEELVGEIVDEHDLVVDIKKGK